MPAAAQAVYRLGMAPLPLDYQAVRKNIRYFDAKNEKIPVAELGPGLSSTSREIRLATWEAIHAAWTPHKEQVASALNQACLTKIENVGSKPMASTVFGIDDREAIVMLAGYAPELMSLLEKRNARNRDGRFRLSDLWLQLPAGNDRRYSFEELWRVLVEAIGAVIPSAVPILSRIKEDGRIHLDGASPYCALSEDDGLPHVYVPFSGMIGDTVMLAHELGHAVHCELTIDEVHPPLIFMEIFSQLFEYLVRLKLTAEADSHDNRLDYLFNSLTYVAVDFLLSPATLDFELRLLELRAHGLLSVDEIVREQDAALKAWFGMSDLQAVFWMRSHIVYEPATPLYSCFFILGRLMSLLLYAQIRSTGSLSEDEFARLVKDTCRLDPIAYLTDNLGADGSDLKSAWEKALRSLRDQYRPLQEF